MLTIAHRGNVFGKTNKENQLLYLLKAVNAGFGVETDLLKAPCGRLIISHDPVEWSPLIDAEIVLKNLALYDAFIVLNIKEEGLLGDLLKITNWSPKNPMKGFVFDFELCCSNPSSEIIKYHSAGFKVAERYSDRKEPCITSNAACLCEYMWVDEMDKSNSLSLSKCSGRKTIYVSPELHNRPRSERRPEEFYGICTDYCI